MKIIIATVKSWNIKNAEKLKENNSKEDIFIITNHKDLTYEKLYEINPDYIFFPHWSWIIPKNIYENFNCIVFHMTDLPYGRGGSPLQNLIVRGIEETMISAIQVEEGIDTGDIYLKEKLTLNGTADEIFIRASEIIFNKMIPRIINSKLMPIKQQGKVVEFKRRKPYESEILSNFDINQIYNYIRMLDGEGYPKAFIKFGKYKLEFSRASLKNNKIIADVEIIDEGD
ncbi:formyltransferase family protein [Clostridium cochlearium]|uniref:formyltransferase family protein n=1 Tax=Clostridium cochlearium TaxID=1494 RepID=UPI00156E467D|nr:formyltransferase family protein [Clostridium cochlearium]MBE6064834.1 methionyl-tRNA formyltransferase [Clostridium cochlearium]NSJ91739.1 methionyl-tRNA formyltransferase [Coprococcus sp. MSK.21.13]